MLNEAPLTLTLPGVNATPLPAFGDAAKFDLTLSLNESAGQTTGFFEYNTDLFDARTIQSLRDSWLALLEEVTADPDRHLGFTARSPIDEPADVHATVARRPPRRIYSSKGTA